MPSSLITAVKATVLITFFVSCSHNQNKKESSFYEINASTLNEVNSAIEPYHLKSNSHLIWSVYENGTKIAESGADGDPGLSFTNFITGNTFGVSCLNGIDNGIGFDLVLTKDSAALKFYALSYNDTSVQFKETPNGPGMPDIQVNCKKSKIILAKEPVFKEGEIIEGKVELESELVHEVIKGEDHYFEFRLTAWFRSEPLPVNNNGYKTLKK